VGNFCFFLRRDCRIFAAAFLICRIQVPDNRVKDLSSELPTAIPQLADPHDRMAGLALDKAA
jgi:hypothetical protein